MCIHVYVYVYVCMYVYIYIYTYIHTYVHIRLLRAGDPALGRARRAWDAAVSMILSSWGSLEHVMHICMCVYIKCVCTYVCMRVCVYMYVYIYIYIYTNTYIFICCQQLGMLDKDLEKSTSSWYKGLRSTWHALICTRDPRQHAYVHIRTWPAPTWTSTHICRV